MNETIIKSLAKELSIKESQVIAVLTLLEEGSTIPLIARYRKEVTGGLDENVIFEIKKNYDYEINLFNRKETVINLIAEKGLLTDELRAKIMAATKLVEVEDLYLPFKEKKKTKATEAIARGLEPFARWMFSFPNTSVLEEAKKYVTGEIEDKKKEVLSDKDAIQGAKDIIAEWISDMADIRKDIRTMIQSQGIIVTKETKKASELDPKRVYQMYYDHTEPVTTIKSHRVLAINRAETEKVITYKIDITKDTYISYLESKIITNFKSTATPYIQSAIVDSFDRLIFPSIEREVKNELTEKAEHQAILLFGENLYKLLLQPPMKGKIVLGIDPAFRTGCKICVIDTQGKRLVKDKMYPHEKAKGAEVDPLLVKRAMDTIEVLCRKYKVELIAIGNGTASRETEAFIAKTIKERRLDGVGYVIVSEAGASVYSAGPIAQKEFPDDEIEERSAASIARRLQDPLSELVKIDPKSIGVGQYQHDVDQKKLNEQLDFIVTQSVNKVGVNLNTASEHLLTYVSGLNKKVAENIVKHRDSTGRFNSRSELLNVSGLKEKTFEQCAGFLRIIGGSEPLDTTSIHPESYEVARNLMTYTNISTDQFGKPELKSILERFDRNKVSHDLNINLFLLNDIIEAFISPQRDPRDEFPQPALKHNVLDIKDLVVGMQLQGTVRNVVDFGAFVDIGLHSDGLVHISRMSQTRINHPMDVVSVGDIISVYVYEVDLPREKVQLSITPLNSSKTIESRMMNFKKDNLKTEEHKIITQAVEAKPNSKPINPNINYNTIKFGDKVKGIVRKISDDYALVDIGLQNYSFLHISCVTKERNKKLGDILKENQEVNAFISDVKKEEKKVVITLFDPINLFF